MARIKSQFERLQGQVADGEVSSKTMLLAMREQLDDLAKVLDNGAIRDGVVREDVVRTLRKIGSFIDLHAFTHSADDTWKLDAEMREQASQLFQEARV